MTIGGIVLCGGQSRRMGKPKAWLPFGDEVMLQRIVRILAGVVSPVVVVAAAQQDVPTVAPPIKILRDARRDRGPLHGLAVGLSALKGNVEAVYVSSCDAPFLQADFVRFMIAKLGTDDIVVPAAHGRLHPLAAVYRLTILPAVEQLLAENCLRLTSLFDRCTTRLIAPEELMGCDPELASLRNVNCPEDYEAALRDLGKNLYKPRGEALRTPGI